MLVKVYLLDKKGYVARCMIDMVKENNEDYNYAES